MLRNYSIFVVRAPDVGGKMITHREQMAEKEVTFCPETLLGETHDRIHSESLDSLRDSLYNGSKAA